MNLLTQESEYCIPKKTAEVLSQIGDTPLLVLRRVVPSTLKVKIYAKAEYLNPGGSIKDRAAWFMICRGISEGSLTKDKIILDASSGNTGIGYALIGASLGYKVTLCIPENASIERIRLLKAYGANLVLTDPLEGMDGAIQTVRKMKADNPDLYFYPDQYNNDANWQAHYFTTGKEIWEQTEGMVTHFVAGLGTSGTFMGVTRRLKFENPNIKAISIQPDSPLHGLEGLKHMASSIVPGIYDPTLADAEITISTEEAQKMTKRLAREEGILAGLSSGAALSAALKVAQQLDEGVVVTIFPDKGDRYLSKNFWK
ncbi:MAG: PLP-dependent cysteine synthase family protein [Promethearchaeota archaeon]